MLDMSERLGSSNGFMQKTMTMCKPFARAVFVISKCIGTGCIAIRVGGTYDWSTHFITCCSIGNVLSVTSPSLSLSLSLSLLLCLVIVRQFSLNKNLSPKTYRNFRNSWIEGRKFPGKFSKISISFWLEISKPKTSKHYASLTKSVTKNDHSRFRKLKAWLSWVAVRFAVCQVSVTYSWCCE